MKLAQARVLQERAFQWIPVIGVISIVVYLDKGSSVPLVVCMSSPRVSEEIPSTFAWPTQKIQNALKTIRFVQSRFLCILPYRTRNTGGKSIHEYWYNIYI
jgi:hypothetical protein